MSDTFTDIVGWANRVLNQPVTHPSPHATGVVGGAVKDVLQHGGVRIGDVVEKEVAGGPDDPSRWFLNSVQDLGIVSAKAVQGLTNPVNVALLGAMAAGNEEAAIPLLTKIGFSASMAADATKSVAAGVKAAKDGNWREAGRQFSSAGVNALFIALGARKGPKGFSVRDLGTEKATPKLTGEVAVPEAPTAKNIPLPSVQEAEIVTPPADAHTEALKAVDADLRKPEGIPVPPAPQEIIHPRTVKAEGVAATVTPDDIRAYVEAKSGKTPMQVRGPDGAPQDLADDATSEAQRIRDVKLSKELHGELFPGTPYRAGLTVGQAAEETPGIKHPVSGHRFSSTQIDIPDESSDKIMALAKAIPDEDLSGEGREKRAHVTVKYGLHEQEAKPVEDFLKGKPPITLTLGKTNFFNPSKSSEGNDVVFVEVDSPELHAINRDISSQFKVTDSHHEYKPHITLAYVKPGLGQKYAGNASLEGQAIPVDEITFSSRNGKESTIKLKGKTTSPPEKTTDDKMQAAAQSLYGKNLWELTTQEHQIVADVAGRPVEAPAESPSEPITDSKYREQLRLLVENMKLGRQASQGLAGDPNAVAGGLYALASKGAANAVQRGVHWAKIRGREEGVRDEVIWDDLQNSGIPDKILREEFPERYHEAATLQPVPSPPSDSRVESTPKPGAALSASGGGVPTLEEMQRMTPEERQRVVDESRARLAAQEKKLMESIGKTEEALKRSGEAVKSFDVGTRMFRGAVNAAQDEVAELGRLVKEKETGEPQPGRKTIDVSPVPEAPNLALTHTPAAKPVPETGWKMSIFSYPPEQAEKYRKAWAPHKEAIKLVPDPTEKGRYYLSTKAKAVVAPPKALGPAPQTKFTPPTGPKPAPWETHGNFVVRRLKELTKEMVGLISEGKDVPTEVEQEYDRLSADLHQENAAEERERQAEEEKSRKPGFGPQSPKFASGPPTVPPDASKRTPATAPLPPEPVKEPSPEEKARLEVTRAGAEPGTVQVIEGEQPQLLFTDPKTKSTLALPLAEVTQEAVQKKIQASRAAIDAARKVDEPLEVGEKKPFIPETTGSMFIGGANKKVPVEYGYMEAADLVPSHDWRTFTAHPDHPGQQRISYEVNPTQKARQEQQFMHPELDRILANSVTGLEGPPIPIKDGSVAGGNGRTMLIQRMYASNEPYEPIGGISRAKYLRDATIKMAQRMGAEGVENLKQPVRVRRIAAPDTMGEWRTLTADLNVSPAAPISSGEQAMSYAGRITPSTLQAIAARLDDLNPDASIREFMSSYPVDFVRWLDESGALTTDDRMAYVDPESGGLNENGKVLFETALLGKAFSDARMLDSAPRSVIDKVASSLAPILRIASRGGEWDIRPLVAEAAQVAGDAHARGLPVRDYVDSIPLLSEIPTVGKVVGALAEFLDRKTAYVKKGFRQYAAESGLKSDRSQGSFITAEVTPWESFNEAFVKPVEEPKPEPTKTKKGKVKQESAAEEAKRTHRNEVNRRRAARYQITEQEFNDALRSAHESRLRANQAK